jgi:hypothetical protein
MGTQQILLIVLSVIIVGIAVAVGITMFANQAENANRQALVGDLQNFGAAAMAFWRMPASMGGAGSSTFGNNTAAVRAGVGQYMGFAAAGTLTNDNGTYTLAEIGANDVFTITALGNEIGQNGSSGVRAVLTVTATNASPLSTNVTN